MPSGELSYAPRSKVIADLTAKILALNSRSNATDSKSRITMGALLFQVQQHLGPSQWIAWLEGSVPFTPRTAQIYIQLHRWAQANPILTPKLAPLGPSKLVLLTRLTPKQLGQLLRRKLHPIPGSNIKRTLEATTVPQLALIVAAIQGALPSPEPPAEQALHNYQRRIRSLGRATEALSNYEALPREAVEELRDALQQTAAALAEAFSLDTD